MSRQLWAHVAIVERRLEALEAAIRSRDWGAVEFAYDQVNRATSKLAVLAPVPPDGGREPSAPRDN